MSLEKVSENIWTVTRSFVAPGVGDIGVRMTMIRLNSGELVLISPVLLESLEVEEIKRIGPVRYLVAPNSLHHLFLKKAHQLFPEAKLMAPPGLLKKRKDLVFDLLVTEDNWPFRNQIEIFVLPARSPLNEEIIFFHKKDRVLITTDMVFNVQKVEGLLPRLISRINRTCQFGMTTLGRLSFKNREKLKAAVQRISEWNPETLIMAHGNIVKVNAKQKLVDSFDWLN